jgi:internalin A
VLRDSIEDLITRRWPGLDYHLFIPCPGLDGTPCPGQFPLDGLLRIRQAGQTGTVPWMGCGRVHEISALLTGFTTPGQPLAVEIEQLRRDTTAQVADIADMVRRVYRVVFTEVTDCPRLFTLTTARPTAVSRRARIYQHHCRLTLWCELKSGRSAVRPCP